MKRIVFMGTPDFSVPVLQTLINSEYEVVLAVTQPDRPKGRKRVITPPPVKVEAEKANIPVFQPEKLKDEYEEILSYNPDLIVTAAYGQLLPNELLEIHHMAVLMYMHHYYQNCVVELQSIMQSWKERKKQELPLCTWLKN